MKPAPLACPDPVVAQLLADCDALDDSMAKVAALLDVLTEEEKRARIEGEEVVN
jgi:hypothetical protein